MAEVAGEDDGGVAARVRDTQLDDRGAWMSASRKVAVRRPSPYRGVVVDGENCFTVCSTSSME
jgi:hypothetical protein